MTGNPAKRGTVLLFWESVSSVSFSPALRINLQSTGKMPALL
jgi:hypothetical protein